MKVREWKNGMLKFIAETDFEKDIIHTAKKFDCLSIRKSKIAENEIVFEPKLTVFCRARVKQYVKKHRRDILDA